MHIHTTRDIQDHRPQVGPDAALRTSSISLVRVLSCSPREIFHAFSSPKTPNTFSLCSVSADGFVFYSLRKLRSLEESFQTPDTCPIRKRVTPCSCPFTGHPGSCGQGPSLGARPYQHHFSRTLLQQSGPFSTGLFSPESK